MTSLLSTHRSMIFYVNPSNKQKNQEFLWWIIAINKFIMKKLEMWYACKFSCPRGSLHSQNKTKTRQSNHLIAIDIFLPQLTFHKSQMSLCGLFFFIIIVNSFFVHRMLLIYQQTSDDSDRLNETINYRKWHRDVCFLINLLFSSSLMVTLRSKKPTWL